MLDTQRIRAITLDLDDTLWPVAPPLRLAQAALRDWLQARAPQAARLLGDAEFMASTRAAIRQQQPSIGHDVGAVMRHIIAATLEAAQADPALATHAFELYYSQRQRVILYDDAQETLQHLAQRYRLVALTNGNADIHAIGLSRYFVASIRADAVGVAKPDAAIFEAAARAAEVASAQVLHVGDDPELDGLGALRVGMQMAWVNRGQAPWPFSDAPRPQLVVNDLASLRQWL